MEAIARSLEADSVPKTARIILVAPPARGGLARHVVSLLAHLHEEGYALGVACDGRGPVAEAARELLLPCYLITLQVGGGPVRAMRSALRLAGAVSRFGAQLVHTHSFSAGLVGALAVRVARSAQLVATIHNYPPRARGMRPQRARDRWAVGQVLRGAARLITVSDGLRHDLLSLYPGLASKAVTISNGIELAARVSRSPREVREELGIPQEGPLVGMVARLAPQKGVREFMRACAEVAARWPEAHFVLAGDGPLRGVARSLRDELGLAGRLELPGEVQSARELISALDVLVVASTSEGSSLAAMEAMAEEKPVVATRVGGVPEVVAEGETGVLVEAGDSGALAGAIDEMLRDPARARELGERGRRRAAERFDVKQMLERTQQVYADLLRDELKAGGDES